MIRVVNIVPHGLRATRRVQDSEPNITVNPARPRQIAITAFTPDPLGGANAPYLRLDGRRCELGAEHGRPERCRLGDRHRRHHAPVRRRAGEGWNLRSGDSFYPADIDDDGGDEVVVVSPDGKWIGVFDESGGGLACAGSSRDWVNPPGGSGASGWNLKPGRPVPRRRHRRRRRHELVVVSPNGQWIGVLRESGGGLAADLDQERLGQPARRQRRQRLGSASRATGSSSPTSTRDDRDELIVVSPNGNGSASCARTTAASAPAGSSTTGSTTPAAAARAAGTSSQPDRFFVADIDGDDRDELIVVSGNGQWIGVLRGRRRPQRRLDQERLGQPPRRQRRQRLGPQAGRPVHRRRHRRRRPRRGDRGQPQRPVDRGPAEDSGGLAPAGSRTTGSTTPAAAAPTAGTSGRATGSSSPTSTATAATSWSSSLPTCSGSASSGVRAAASAAAGSANDWVNHPGGSGANGWDLKQGDRFFVADIDADDRTRRCSSPARTAAGWRLLEFRRRAWRQRGSGPTGWIRRAVGRRAPRRRDPERERAGCGCRRCGPRLHEPDADAGDQLPGQHRPALHRGDPSRLRPGGGEGRLLHRHQRLRGTRRVAPRRSRRLSTRARRHRPSRRSARAARTTWARTGRRSDLPSIPTGRSTPSSPAGGLSTTRRRRNGRRRRRPRRRLGPEPTRSRRSSTRATTSPGMRVVDRVNFTFNFMIGQERISCPLSIAVDPRSSDRVWVAWGDLSPAASRRCTSAARRQRRHVECRPSHRRRCHQPRAGGHVGGLVGLMYQALTGDGADHAVGDPPRADQRRRGHLERRHPGHRPRRPPRWHVPALHGRLPRTGRRTATTSTGSSARTTRRGRRTSPAGRRYLRNANWPGNTLRNVANTANVAASIDPFFVKVTPAPDLQDGPRAPASVVGQARRLASLGGVENGTPWRLTVRQVIDRIGRTGNVLRGGTRRRPRRHRGRPDPEGASLVKTVADGDEPNNLLALPDCP